MTAAMTLKSDTSAVKVYVKRPRGTLYWGGAGLDGPYIEPQLRAFKDAGIRHADVGLTNTFSKSLGRTAGPILDAVRSGLFIRNEDNGEWVISRGMEDAAPQFNLIGYSYGSLLAAQTANFYAKQGHIVDHLVLIASPISSGFLSHLRYLKTIKNIVIIDLTKFGDPLHAGIGVIALVKAVPLLQEQQSRNMGEGHFYYAHVVPDSPSRWKSLAQQLINAGLQ